MISKIKELEKMYQRLNYQRFNVNLFEENEFYYQNQDYINQKSIIKALNPSGDLYGLQADVTLSCSKMYSNSKQNICKSQRYFYNTYTYEADKSIRKNISINHVLGIECFGIDDIYTDVEVLQLAYQTLEILKRDFIIELSMFNVIKRLLNKMNLNRIQIDEILEIVFSKNISLLIDKLDEYLVNRKLRDDFVSLCEFNGCIDDGLFLLKRFCDDEFIFDSYEYLKELSSYLKVLKIDNRVVLDFTLRMDNNYYSGLVFKGYIKDVYACILNGGRYNNLVTSLNNDFKAVGFSINLNYLKNRLKNKSKVDCLLIYDEANLSLFKLVEQLKDKYSLSVIQQDCIVDKDRLLENYTIIKYCLNNKKEGDY